MKTLSLWQPWASLIAIGAKQIETRDWSTGYRGALAIHAAKYLIPEFGEICNSEPFVTALRVAGYTEMECFEFGKVVAIVDLAQVATTEEILEPGVEFPGDFLDASRRAGELDFGNYGPKRFGFLLKNLRRFPEAIPAVGHQKLWDWPVEWCDGCDGTGLMEGWSRRDGWPCPKCKGMAITPKVLVARL